MIINIQLDQASLDRVHSLLIWEATLQKHLLTAMSQSLEVLDTQAADNMSAGFQNSTGALRDTLEQHVYGPFESELVTDSPYAWRREAGFSGKTDSIGRYYPYDPGIQYMGNALSSQKSEIYTIFRDEIELALHESGGY